MSTPASPARPNVTCALPEWPSQSDLKLMLDVAPSGRPPAARPMCHCGSRPRSPWSAPPPSNGAAVLGCPSPFIMGVSSDDLPSPPVPGGQGPLYPPKTLLPGFLTACVRPHRHRCDDDFKRVSPAQGSGSCGLSLVGSAPAVCHHRWAEPLSPGICAVCLHSSETILSQQRKSLDHSS